ncbi:cupredoxin domain-containing protein [Streptomyces sp. NPDC002577]
MTLHSHKDASGKARRGRCGTGLLVAATVVGVVSTLGAGYGSGPAEQAAGQQTHWAATAAVPTISVNTPKVPSAVQNVNISNFAFSPSTLTVSRGTTVTWTNYDSTPHSVKSNGHGRGQLHSGRLSQGESYSFQFNSPGTYSYHCCFHPSMVATVIVK